MSGLHIHFANNKNNSDACKDGAPSKRQNQLKNFMLGSMFMNIASGMNCGSGSLFGGQHYGGGCGMSEAYRPIGMGCSESYGSSNPFGGGLNTFGMNYGGYGGYGSNNRGGSLFGGVMTGLGIYFMGKGAGLWGNKNAKANTQADTQDNSNAKKTSEIKLITV